MSGQLKSSMSGPRRRRHITRARQAAGPTEERYPCEVVDCERDFQHQTDRSRHYWSHLPARYYPRCPYEGPFGEGCDVPYQGRTDQWKYHWENVHTDRPFPKRYRWPKLRDIIMTNGIILGQDVPDVPPAPPMLPGPFPAHVGDFEQARAGPFMMQPQVPLHIDHPSLHPHAHNPSYSAHLVEQYVTPLPPTSFIRDRYPPFSQHQHIHTSYNNPVGYGPELPYPNSFAGPSSSHSPASSQHSQHFDTRSNHPGTPAYYPGTPNYSDNGAYSPIGGPYTPPFDPELERQGSSTNPNPRHGDGRQRDWSPHVNDEYREF